MRKYNVIIDCDPGVDDLVAIIPAVFREKLNILLFSTVAGNVDVDQCTNNLLHILEVFDKDIPVVKGAEKPLKREHKDAKFIHGPYGTGKYKPALPVKKPIDLDVTKAMYEQILKHKKNIYLVCLGPITNVANLIKKHPDVKEYICKICAMSTSSWGKKSVPTYLDEEYISYNTSSDPEAFKIVLESKIPLVLFPSEIGRYSCLSPDEVEMLKNYKHSGKILYPLLNGYWEPGAKDKFVAMNDSCCMIGLTNPRLFKFKNFDIELDLKTHPGKTVYKPSKEKNVKIAVDVNRKQFHKFFFKSLKDIENFLEKKDHS